MVKGVNKNVIEVNSTESEVFEKIVFYVSPDYATMGADLLKAATSELERALCTSDTKKQDGLRLRVKRKKQRKRVFVTVSLLLLAVAAVIVLKLI